MIYIKVVPSKPNDTLTSIWIIIINILLYLIKISNRIIDSELQCNIYWAELT